ncbi:MAG: TM2 domain-containing protein [Geminicoccaceae bacterium]
MEAGITKKKSIAIAYLLLIFLWPIAAHRFYLGHFGLGWAMSFTLVCTSFMTMIDFQSNLHALAASLPAMLVFLILLADLFRMPTIVRDSNRKLMERCTTSSSISPSKLG